MKQSYCRLFYMLATMAAASSLCAQQSEKPEFRYIANPPPPATGPHTGTLDVFIQKLKPQGELPLSFLKAEHGDLAAWKAETSPAAAPATAGPINIGSRRELFVDDYLIDKMNGTRLKLHEPRCEGTVFRFDQPWDGVFCTYATIIRDDFGNDGKAASAPRAPVYRLYYVSDHGICVAESPDGIRWTRPEYDDQVFTDKETGKTFKMNRILSQFSKSRQKASFAPFIDTRPDVPADQRYKGFFGGAWGPPDLMTSADGIHWKSFPAKRPAIQGDFDSHNIGFYSESEKCYVFYYRKSRGNRWVYRSTSPDFVDWSEGVEMEANAGKSDQLYTSSTTPYFRAPHVYIALASRYTANRSATTEEQRVAAGLSKDYLKASGFNETVLLTSRGGTRYDRTFLEGFIRPGLGVKAWTTRSQYAAWGIVPTPDSDTHLSFYVARELGYKSNHLERYTLRYDGFVSVNAPVAGPKGWEMVTKPLTFSGKRLLLNYSTGATGQIQVEIQDAEGKPLPGWTAKDCQYTVGDEIERPVLWKNGGDLSTLAGKSVRLRFVMWDADLYAIRFE